MSLAQLSNLLPLPEEDLKQVLNYAATLSKQEAAEHFNNLLGESSASIEFISSFNAKRQDSSPVSPKPPSPPSQNSSYGVPKGARKGKKKASQLHTPKPRQVQDNGDNAAQGHAYKKKDEDDYMSVGKKLISASAGGLSLTTKPTAVQAPTPRAPPSAAGALISDFTKAKSHSTPATRISSPAPAKTLTPPTKVSITGGTSMKGASNVLSDLDAAIRSLEISTNSSLLLDSKKRACNCIGARHPLLTAAPNCLNCGKVICVKEGLGPCTFCGTQLLSALDVQGMIRALREERGREKMSLDSAAHRRAEVSKKPVPFQAPKPTPLDVGMSLAEQKAKEHRDKLLNFQAQNAARTTVHDEAADFDLPVSGTSMWASPAERARQLKRQQKVLAEQEWNARPEYEKRRQVVSIDVVKGKVVRKMAKVERPEAQAESSDEETEPLPLSDTSGNKGRGIFSRNPLLGGLIKPVWNAGKGKTVDDGRDAEPRRKTWRRVQDDLDDNEEIILDGGAFGGRTADRVEHDEPGCRCTSARQDSWS